MKKKTFSINGHVVNTQTKKGISGLRVEAWDKDLAIDDLLGTAKTDKNGRFTLSFNETYYQEICFDRKPDVYFKVFHKGKLIKSTEDSVLWNVKAGETTINITVSIELPQVQYIVKGTVTDKANNPLPDLQVKAIQRYLRQETLLGSGQTNAQGVYNISFFASIADESGLDLALKVIDQEGKPVHQTGVHHDVPKEAEIDIQVPIVFPGFSEFEKMSRMLQPLLAKGLTFAALEQNAEHDDIIFLAGKTGIEVSSIARFAVAHKLGKLGIQPEFWFALLGGSLFQYTGNQSLKEQLAAVLDALTALDAAAVHKALTRSFNLEEIPGTFREKVADWVEAFLKFAASHSVSGTDKPTFVKLALDHAGIQDVNKQETFARLFNEYRTITPELLDTLEKDKSFTKVEIADLRTSFKLAELTRADFSVVKMIKEEFGVRQTGDIRSLAKKSENDWVNLVKEKYAAGAITLPFEVSEMPGEMKIDEAEVYGKTLERQFREAFPTTAFAGGLERALGNDKEKKQEVPGIHYASDMVSFLNAHKDFEFLNTSIDDFLKNSVDPESGPIAKDEEFRSELKAVQRVFKLAPTFGATSALLADGVHSARKVYRMGKSQFVRRYADREGFTKKSAGLAWNRAADTHAAVLTLIGDINSFDSGTLPQALKNSKAFAGGTLPQAKKNSKMSEGGVLPQALETSSEALSIFPNWDNLFKAGDLCECEDCRSVLSPAAYFADLLMFLKDREAVNSDDTVKGILFDRRPDLGYLELNCDNALTPLPYIDVVCEVLEDVVDVNGENDLELKNFSVMPVDSAEAKTAVTDAFKDAFTDSGNNGKEKIQLGDDFSISQVNSLDPDQWVVHGDNVTYLLKKKPSESDFFAEILRNTKTSAEELRAYPQYVNPKAYNKLKLAKYPLTLPFDLFAEEVRAAFRKSNLQRWDLMRTLRGTADPNNPTNSEIAAEYFGISADPGADFDEKRLILKAKPGEQQEVWGEKDNAEWLDTVGNVKTFLWKTNLEYNEMLALLDLEFINPGGNLYIEHADSSCDTDKKSIHGLRPKKLDRIHRFLRMWRKLKDWKMWELDLVICHPAIGNGKLNKAFFVQLFYFCRIKDKLGNKATVERLCALFGDLNTRTHFTQLYKKREDGLYQSLFLNKRLINPLDPVFEIDLTENEIKPIIDPDTGQPVIDPDTGSQKFYQISDHLSVILAALGVKESDLVILKELTKASDSKQYITDDLTLSNLSFLWRHAWLSLTLKFKVEEWKNLLKIFQQDVLSFSNPQVAWEFLEKIDYLKATGFTMDELNWLLAADRFAKAAVKETDAARFLTDLRKELQAIKAEYDPSQYDFLSAAPPTDVDKLTTLLTSLLQKLGRDDAGVRFFLAALRGSVLLEASAPGLPAGFAFPVGITGAPNYIHIFYDETNTLFKFTGQMTDTQREILLDETKEAMTTLRGTGQLDASVTGLPAGFAFPGVITGDPNNIPILYDETNTLFKFTGLMTDTQREILLNDDSPALAALRGTGQLDASAPGLPAGFAFPDVITGDPNYIPILYDETNTLFRFTGLMIDTQREMLLNDDSLVAIRDNPGYRNAIEDLYQQSLKKIINYRSAIEELYQQSLKKIINYRSAIEELYQGSLEAMSYYLSMEANLTLPGDFTFPATITGAPNGIPIRYEQVLRFVGVMTDAERNILLNDSSLTTVTGIPSYQQAIGKLFKYSGPAAVTDLPDGFTFPAVITSEPNHIPISYDQVLRFTGLMTAAQQTTLLTDPSLSAVTDITAYQEAIEEFFTRPRLALKFFELIFTTPLENLPADVSFATLSLPDLAAKIAYDVDLGLLSFVGIMSEEEKTALLVLSNDETYQSAIINLFYQPEGIFTTSLENLPDGVSFASLSLPDLEAKISYDAEQQILRFLGIMSEEEKTALLALSTDETYQSAITNLFNQPVDIASPDERIWLTNSDLDTTQPDNNTLEKRLANAASKALIYLSKTLSNNAVVQQSASQLGLTEELTRRLMTQYAILPDTLMTHLRGTFADTIGVVDYDTLEKTFDGWYWANRVAVIWNKWKITLPELEKIMSLTDGAQLFDFETLPLDNTGAIPPIDLFLRTSRLLRFRDTLPETQITLLEVLEKLNTGSYTSGDFAADVELLNEDWLASDVEALIASLDLTYPNDYLLPESWERLRRAFYFLDNLNAGADKAITFAEAAMTYDHAKTIKELLHSKFGEETWLTLSAEIQDVLRERKRDALTAYLLTQEKPGDAPSGKWENTNDLYAYYLLDVEMSSCQLTSRLVQGSGSIQLFVQRCFMGLEPDVVVNAEGDNGDSAWLWWEWMRKYRVWEANRKVFLWPENWIEPELKKDRSSFFKDLENELLQNEINEDNVETAFLNYLEKLGGVAHLEIAGFYQEDDGDDAILHVFGRTMGAEPHLYYYRYYDYRQWTPWEKVELDIQGDYLIPAVVNKRLFLFWPVFTEAPDEEKNSTAYKPPADQVKVNVQTAYKKLRLQMAVSEYRQGKWTPKRVSKDFDESDSYDVEIVRKHYRFFPIDRSEVDGRFFIKYEGYSLASAPTPTQTKTLIKLFTLSLDGDKKLPASLDGAFELSGCNGSPELTLDFSGNFKHAIQPESDATGEDTSFMKWVELSKHNNSSQNDFTLENCFSQLFTKFSHYFKFTPILMQTPGIFKMSPPWHPSYFDKMWLDGLEFLNSRGIIDIQLTSIFPSYIGSWLPFFYNDKKRTFFVLPTLMFGSVRYYYPEVKEFFQQLEDFFKGGVQTLVSRENLSTLTSMEREELEEFLYQKFKKDTPPPPYTIEQVMNLATRLIMRVVHFLLSEWSLLWFQFRQFHFKNFYHPFVCDFANLVYNPLKGIPALMSRETQLKNTGFDFYQTYRPTLWVVEDIPLSFSLTDIKDLESFALKLAPGQDQDNVSTYIWEKLSLVTRNALTNYQESGSDPDLLLNGLVDDLNEIIEGTVYEIQRFAGVDLRPRTQVLLALNPNGDALIRLNRLLLEDAYPGELSRDLDAYPKEVVDFSPAGAYSPYNWELFFHAPLLIANSLSKNQRFEEAREWYHFIFNPIGVESSTPGGSSMSKYWITKPFFETTDPQYVQQRIDNILSMLAGDTSITGYSEQAKKDLEDQVTDWRTNPFEPHRIANYRTVAYQKTVVMKYLDNLVTWGDYLFRQDSMESINEATQLYILAAEILGPRPKIIPSQGKPPMESFNELEYMFEDGKNRFGNPIVELEKFIPCQGNGSNVDNSAPLPMLYFCIPKNEKMLGYWDTVADRLYKIRHCMNIEGVVRQLALFEPPIDPGALVKAVAGGLDISSALADLNAPLPLYRFNVLLQKANEVCNDVKALGGALLAALEKKDAEELSLLRQSQEIKLLEAVKTVREKQFEEAKENLEGLKLSKVVIETRRDYYRDIEKIIAGEQLGLDKQSTAQKHQVKAQGINIQASLLGYLPNLTFGFSGYGGSPHVNVQWGTGNIISALQAFSGAETLLANIASYEANKAVTLAGYDRRFADWKLQERLAEKELTQMDKQIASAELRISIAEKELENHLIQIENAKATDEFMHSKYTNKELYQWQVGQISGVYFQSYKLAYDLAKRAERCFRYELGLQDSSYIQFGYWDSLKKGLLSGEKLQYDLRRLETAYLEQNRREFELTKHISLVLLDPLALIKLRETGRCFFSLPEEIFDLDFPGHYFRRIKSVSITLPCVVGPYTTISCTLRLLKNSLRINTANGDNDYPRNTDGQGLPADDIRFIENNIPVKAIAASSGQNDSGVFELNFRDERYLPFEGAGVISQWSLELFNDLPSNNPDFGKPLRQFDYSTISDAILHIKYTAREDAGVFKNGAIDHLRYYFSEDGATPSLRLFNLRQGFPTQWHRFLHPTDPASDNIFELEMSPSQFPIRDTEKTLKVNTIWLLARCTDPGTYNVAMTPLLDPPNDGSITMNLAPVNQYGGLHFNQKDVTAQGIEVVPTDPPIKWQLIMTRPGGGNLQEDPVKKVIEVEDVWLVLGYEWEE
jgi:hypothetical protein